MLSGDNGLLKRAGDARDETIVGQEKEQVELAYISAAVKKLGDNVTEGELQIELDSSVGNDKTDVSTNDNDTLNVYFTDTKHNYNVDSNGNVKKYIAPEQITIAKAKLDGTIFTEKTTLIDDYNNKVIVPKGFGISTDSGTKVEEGIVIEDLDNSRDTYGSQFVWIPVGTEIKVSTEINTNKTIDILLGRYVFNSDGSINTSLSVTQVLNQLKTSSSASIYYSEGRINDTTSNIHAKDIEGFINSVNSNKGYYIARYEAGIKGTTNSTTSSKLADGITSKNSNSAAQIVTKSGVGVWNYINQTNAASVCKNMYSTSDDEITSDLINSYAWDTAIVFIQKCGNNGEDSSKYSKQCGYSETGNITTTGTSKLKYVVNSTSIIRTTKILDSQCKIFDMAGNVWEWTTETCSKSGKSGVHRGGVYGNPLSYPDFRDYYSPTSTDELFGFRPVLYF